MQLPEIDRLRLTSVVDNSVDILLKDQGPAKLLCDPGYCGKSDQHARVTDGGTHICVSDIVVGGLS